MMDEKPGQYIDSESPFCRNCTRDDCPTNGDGCKAWETYFIDNWNKNIMKSIGNHKKQRQFFRYEHPDLVREGIVFEHEQGENVRLFQAGERRPNTMTIDRAIEILDPEHREHYDGMDEVNEAFRIGMEALERTRWIPCGERLPEIGVTVLTLDKYKHVASRTRKSYVDGTPYFYPDGLEPGRHITHWMPIPEPPEEE